MGNDTPFGELQRGGNLGYGTVADRYQVEVGTVERSVDGAIARLGYPGQSLASLAVACHDLHHLDAVGVECGRKGLGNVATSYNRNFHKRKVIKKSSLLQRFDPQFA
jgi:hypothetical protein